MPHRVREREREHVSRGSATKQKATDEPAQHSSGLPCTNLPPPIPGEMRPMYKTFACHFHASSHVKTFLTPFRILTNSLMGMGSRGEGCSGHFTLLVIRVCVIWTCSRLTAAKERAERRATSQVLQVVAVF